MTRRHLYLAAVCVLSVSSLPSRARTLAAVPTVTTCDAANPFDYLPDDVALQSCLDNYDWVLLKPDYLPGYVGYLVGDTLKLKRAGGLLTTADNPHKATIRAAPPLTSSMLRASGINNFEISFIRFDGNWENRSVRDKPCDAGHKVVGDPSVSGGDFSDNRVSSGYNLLGFGIMVGCHPWSQCGGGYASNVAVYNNSSTGAVVNLAVDGLSGGSVWNNSIKGARGSRVLNCPGASADYTIGHVINVAPLQTAYVVRIFDVGSNCQ